MPRSSERHSTHGEPSRQHPLAPEHGPKLVNSDSVHDGTDQFFQAVAVDPVTGAVYVQFYDRGGDPSGLKTSITLARSTRRSSSRSAAIKPS
jgi:hypothetical protein